MSLAKRPGGWDCWCCVSPKYETLGSSPEQAYRNWTFNAEDGPNPNVYRE